MLDALVFWLLAFAVGLIGLPFAAILFERLPGGGLALARPLGLLVVAYPLWLLASLHAVDYGRAAAALTTALVAGVSLLIGLPVLRGRPRRSISIRLWLVGECVFSVCFAGWALLRGFSPDVLQTEKPMDMAIVNAINKSGSFPPHDPWFAGTHLNYYYFGHYVNAFLIRLTGIDSAAGYNLAAALFFALSVTATYAVASALYLALRKQAHAPAVAVAVPGLAAAAFAVAGNLAGAVDYLDHPARFATFNWFGPSRVIPNTANEFPFFSFLLGDLHAHVLAPPFALTTLAYTMQICLSGPRRIQRGQASSYALAVGEIFLAALVLGVLYAVNSLDYPTAVVIAILAVVLWLLAEPRTWLSTLVWTALWIGGSVLLFLPFWTDFDPTTNGVGLVGERTHFSVFLKDEFLIYGLLLWVVGTLLTRRRVPVPYLVWGGIAAAVVLVLLSPSRLASVLLGLGLTAITLFVALAGERPQAERFVWLLVAAGIALIGIGEFVYVRDSFDGTASFRFNTVFKAGYQAWFLLSIVAGCVVVWNRAWLRGWLGRFWRAGFACLVVLVLIYPVVGSYARSGGFGRSPTLDGMAWLERSSPGDAASIRWLRSHAPASSIRSKVSGPTSTRPAQLAFRPSPVWQACWAGPGTRSNGGTRPIRGSGTSSGCTGRRTSRRRGGYWCATASVTSS